MTISEIRNNLFSISIDVGMLMPEDWIKQNKASGSKFQETIAAVLNILTEVEASKDQNNE